jgi:hypothetical protein
MLRATLKAETDMTSSNVAAAITSVGIAFDLP